MCPKALSNLSSDFKPHDLDQLVATAEEGDSRAEAMLYLFLFDRFKTIARRRTGNLEDAEDMAQDACLTLLQKYKSATFRSGFDTWAYRILWNKIGNYYQKSKLEQASKRGVVPIELFITHNPPANPIIWELRDCLHRIRERNPRYAQVLELRSEGYEIDEICQRLRVSRNNCYAILHRGRQILRKCLETGRI